MEPFVVPLSDNPNPLNVLTTEVQIATWNSEGLPSDSVSTENGTICCSTFRCVVFVWFVWRVPMSPKALCCDFPTFTTCRWPLLIDPQLQGIAWIREKEGASLVVGRLTQKDLVQQLSIAVTNGTPFLIENMGASI